MFDAGRLHADEFPDAAKPLVTVELPLYLRGSQNAREHWAKRSRRVKHERQTTALLVRSFFRPIEAIPEKPVITITRYGSVLIRDNDNLSAACKAVRDGIADALGIDDGDPRITWRYEQGRSRRGQERVEVTIA